MAKIARKTQKIFASTPGTNQVAQFGSYAAGSAVYSTDPAVIQSLSNYLVGWFDAVIGANSPCIEDMNALCFLFAYQLAYIFQQGIPEYDSGTTYYVGSLAQDGSGNIYVCQVSPTSNVPLSNSSNWLLKNNTSVVDFSSSTTSYNLLYSDNTKTFWMPTTKATTLILPSPIANFFFTVKDVGGTASSFPVTIQPSGGNIENLSGNYTCQSDYGTWTFTSDGTNWFIDN